MTASGGAGTSGSDEPTGVAPDTAMCISARSHGAIDDPRMSKRGTVNGFASEPDARQRIRFRADHCGTSAAAVSAATVELHASLSLCKARYRTLPTSTRLQGQEWDRGS